MTRDDIIRMADEAGIYMDSDTDHWYYELARFATLVAAAEREKLAHWMNSLGYATGHADTIEHLLDQLGTQIEEGLKAEALMEREACCRIVTGLCISDNNAHEINAKIREGGEA